MPGQQDGSGGEELDRLEEEQMRQALALSLLESEKGQGQPSQRREVIVLDSESDTQVQSGQEINVLPLQKRNETTDCTASSSLLGLDRRQMEEDRLARKRKREPSTTQIETRPETASTHAPQPSRSSSTVSLSPLCEPGQFLAGIVRKTFAAGYDRTSEDITIDEIIQASHLRLAVFSSFQWNMQWLLSKLDLQQTRVLLVMQAKSPSDRQHYQEEASLLGNLRLCFPSMEGQINCMHSKLMLLSYQDHLRIVVPTANLVPYDWGETGTMENTVFMIDLPRLPAGKRVLESELTPFGQELLYFLKAKGLEQHIIDSVCAFDFAATQDMAFVHTIGGAHVGSAWQLTGYCGLGTAMQRLGINASADLQLDFVTSSVGSLDMDFLANLYAACSGDTGLAEYEERTAPKSKHSTSHLRPLENGDIGKNIRIYFPTHDTVRTSRARTAGTICMQSSYYENAKFPKGILRDCVSLRRGMLMHNKLMFIRVPSARQAFAYVGSANCSQSAWGNRLVKDRITKGPKLNCRNWECGVLLPIRSNTNSESDMEDLEIFKDTVPVPIEYPGARYQGRKPWYFLEAH